MEGQTVNQAEGTGVGLALTLELVKLLKGDIQVRSEEGKGATFMVTLPITRTSELSSKPLEHAMAQLGTTSLVQHPAEIAPVSDEAAAENRPHVLIVEDISAFKVRYGTNLPVAGQWNGRLSNSGETLTLIVGNEEAQQFAYDDAWHETTDGDGHSLEIINVFEADVATWAEAESWRPSRLPGGSPGRENEPARIPGDSNGDGRFDSSDFVTVFQAAEYEDGIPQNSTFEEGDWNGDGDFDSRDFVFAFQKGNYQRDVAAVEAAFQGQRSYNCPKDIESRQRRQASRSTDHSAHT